jgi:hypothetical protein
MHEIALLRELVNQLRSDRVSLNSSCKKIAEELSETRWTGNYVKTLIGNNPPNPGSELRSAIRRLHRKKTRKPPAKRYWLKTEAGSETEKNEWVEKIPMARRQELFRQEIERLDQDA